MDKQREPLVHPNSPLQRYYESLETRIGYRLVLGGRRHYGYYAADAWWPFPITAALQRMEDHLFSSLKLQPGSRVLEAGCGDGHVAMHLAGKGLQIYGIDILKRHVRRSQQNVKSRGFEKAVTIRLGDYHNLENLHDESFDGVYTIEALMHATDFERAVQEFFRVLKPGGSIAFYEYDHLSPENTPKDVPASVIKGLEQVNRGTAMPANELFERGVLTSMLEKHGFQDVAVEDISDNIRPMIMLFFILAYIPFLFIRLLGLEARFVNTLTGIQCYNVAKWRLWRYLAVTAKKPSAKVVDDRELYERESR
ncbi:MAG: hypothetical protein LQ342_003452 [Letrouitia transgressa]|nr:MAG: hypothetical protein LQ342_003452 [Letrouitia transgressa]